MRKWIPLSVLCVVLAVLCGGLSIIQAQVGDLKPTFLAPTPGLYVHGWPRFTVSYPKEWVEQPVLPGEVFRTRSSSAPLPAMALAAFLNPMEISQSINFFAGILGQGGYKDIKVLYSKPSTLQDGTPIQESEVEFSPPNAATKLGLFEVAAKKDGVWIWVHVINEAGRIGEDLKKITYSLRIAPGKSEPVSPPSDVRALLDDHCKAVDSADISRVMSNFSDRYLNNGTSKAAMEQWFRFHPFSPITAGSDSWQATVMFFEAQGDKAYLAGFFGGKLKTGAPTGSVIPDNQIIREDGKWKWYGNQK